MVKYIYTFLILLFAMGLNAQAVTTFKASGQSMPQNYMLQVDLLNSDSFGLSLDGIQLEGQLCVDKTATVPFLINGKNHGWITTNTHIDCSVVIDTFVQILYFENFTADSTQFCFFKDSAGIQTSLSCTDCFKGGSGGGSGGSIQNQTGQWFPIILNGVLTGYNYAVKGSNGEQFTNGFEFPIYTTEVDTYVTGVDTFWTKVSILNNGIVVSVDSTYHIDQHSLFTTIDTVYTTDPETFRVSAEKSTVLCEVDFTGIDTSKVVINSCPILIDSIGCYEYCETELAQYSTYTLNNTSKSNFTILTRADASAAGVASEVTTIPSGSIVLDPPVDVSTATIKMNRYEFTFGADSTSIINDSIVTNAISVNNETVRAVGIFTANAVPFRASFLRIMPSIVRFDNGNSCTDSLLVNTATRVNGVAYRDYRVINSYAEIRDPEGNVLHTWNPAVPPSMDANAIANGVEQTVAATAVESGVLMDVAESIKLTTPGKYIQEGWMDLRPATTNTFLRSSFRRELIIDEGCNN